MSRIQDNPEKVMPLIEHIRELRNRILVSMLAFPRVRGGRVRVSPTG
jgi:Sec-independent protein secretion pathway component TatC